MPRTIPRSGDLDSTVTGLVNKFHDRETSHEAVSAAIFVYNFLMDRVAEGSTIIIRDREGRTEECSIEGL